LAILYQMQSKRSRIVWFVAIAIAFIFILDPFRLFESDNIPRMRVNQDLQAEMEAFLATAPEADQYIVDELDSHDLVVIGETGYVKEQLDFLAALIPALDEAGIRHLGYQYANSADQALIDDLVTGESFDESLANRILFNNMVILGYEEYRNVFRAAWEVNRGKPDAGEPFRIIGIGSPPDYTLIVDPDDVDDPEVLSRVFANGIPDSQMAETVMQQIVNRGHRAVVYTKLEHAFTGFPQVQYSARMEESGFPGRKRMGNILKERLGDRVMTVMYHMPLQDTRSRTGYGFPIGGLMDQALETLPEGRRPGFRVDASPYGEAPITSDTLTEGLDEDLTLEQVTDGYLLISRIGDYEVVTPIDGFITAENIGRARSQFPGPDPGEVTVEDMNEFIVGTLGSMTRIFEGFE